MDAKDWRAVRIEQLEAENTSRKAELAAAQAKIDRLMLEFCPEEMTEEQTDEWARSQQPAHFPFSADRVTHHKIEIAAPKPVAWVRRHPDGALTAEFLEHAVIGPARMGSGAWLPLYTRDRYALNTLDLIAANERAEAVEQQLLDAQARIAELESLHEKMVEFHGSSVRDAKRYRWLREHLNDTDSLTDLWPEGAEKTPTPDELDNAIDKALGE